MLTINSKRIIQMTDLIRAKQVAQKRGRSLSRLYADIAEDRFPKGIKLGNKIVVWRETDVDAHIEAELKQAIEQGGEA
jgi:predicted DNA-binding transcriptional regulator AlpA